jgi:hypothetical protein
MKAYPLSFTFTAPEARVLPAFKPQEEARFLQVLKAGFEAGPEFDVVEAEEAIHVQVFVTEDEEYEVRDIVHEFAAKIAKSWAGTIPASHLA